MAIYVRGELLLLRLSYRRAWNLPGGGVRSGESPEAAARRELGEELGVTVGNLAPSRVVSGVWDGRPDRVHIYELHLTTLPHLRVDNREVLAARLFSPRDLPGLGVTGAVAAYLAEAAPPTSRPGMAGTVTS